ncbi:MAG: hypothetical protein ACNI28_02875 [Arcobacter sp.]|uniref:hypothetical protein n=1 Tax=Arcobacter sp. TaxID=1872629 RepID=UPI003AFFDC2D
MLRKIILTTVILLSVSLSAKDLNNIKSQMNKLKVNTALVVPSQAVDEYPLWSKDGQYLFANVMGKWYKVNLNDIELAPTKWRKDKALGVINSKNTISLAETNEINKPKQQTKFGAREYITNDNTKFEFKRSKMGTQFIITKNKNKPSIQWSSGMENCHSFTSNEKENYIAFICEMNGVFIYKIIE